MLKALVVRADQRAWEVHQPEALGPPAQELGLVAQPEPEAGLDRPAGCRKAQFIPAAQTILLTAGVTDASARTPHRRCRDGEHEVIGSPAQAERRLRNVDRRHRGGWKRLVGAVMHFATSAMTRMTMPRKISLHMETYCSVAL